MNLHGRTALLTGATGGIGHAIARRLHAAGASLILTGRRTDVLEPLAHELGARSLAVDLALQDEVRRLADEAADVDIVVANAGLQAGGLIFEFTEDQVDRALNVNLRAPMILAKLIGEKMIERREGHLVFISSLSGKAGTARTSIYNATKFGLRGFGQGLRADLRPFGVGVSVIFPGFISDAGMFADAGAKLPPGVGTSTPEQVANAVVRAIERDKGEVDVAPFSMRAATKLASLAPELSATITRKSGGDKVAEQLAAGHAQKR